MNCFFILLLYFLVRVRCDTVSKNGPNIMGSDNDQQRGAVEESTNILASVRQYPSLLHKCTATFIAADALLTTAKCLYCENCDLYVHAFSSHLTDDNQDSGTTYNIKKTVIHPNYERFPQKNDVGLIQLQKKVSKAVVFQLRGTVPDFPGLIVDTYRWKFTSNLRDYNLERVTEQIISNAACSSFFNYYIDYTHICTRRNQSISLGQFDQGVPVVDKTSGVGTILGIYDSKGMIQQSQIGIYNAIFPSVAWINQTLACNFRCSSSQINETTPAPASIPTASTESTSPTPTLPPLSESTEARETEIESKTPIAKAGGANSQRNDKPFAWSDDFPFSELKQPPFRPKALSGKHYT